MPASDRIAPETLVQENRVACESGIFLRHRPGPQARSPNDRRHPPRRARARVSARGPGVGVDDPILVGHSDGGSIALLYAAARGGVRGLVLMAPHVFVEDVSVKSIARAKTAFESTDLPQRLGRHHADAAKTFRGWNDIWLHPDFRGWNIEEVLPRVVCPALVIQGFDDEYGTMAQLEAIAKQTGGPVELLRLADCRHSPHRDQPGVVLEATARFIGRLDGA